MLVGAVGAAAFVAALLGTVIVPRAARRVAGAPPPPIRPRPDTLLIQQRVNGAGTAVRRSEAALSAAEALVRARSAGAAAPRTRADSLAAGIATLDRLVALADRAPLPSSYRALGDAPPMRRDPRVRVLLDSLDVLERRRTTAGAAAGGVDSSYAVLTERATAIGRTLRGIARARRDTLQSDLAALAGTAPAWVRTDTARLHRRRDSARVALASARRWLAQARVVDGELDAEAASARATAALDAAIPAALAASIVLGLIAGFVAAFVLELREPRVADAAEAEALAGAPVVARLTGAERAPARRRAVDREVPPLIEVDGSAYDVLYTRLADRTFDLGLLAVVGDDRTATALVATNLAATAARQVRSTIVVDADLDGASAAAVVRARATPGLADVLAGRATWASATRSIVVGRGRTMELLPPGARHGARDTLREGTEELTRVLAQLRRRYDAVVVSAARTPRGDAGVVGGAAGSVLVVARTAHTPTSVLSALAVSLRASGVWIRGVVLWDREVPPVPVAPGAGAGDPPPPRS